MFAIVQNGNIVQFVQPDTPFTVGDKQYSAGFIRNATPEELKAAGVWNIVYGPQADQRFYWVGGPNYRVNEIDGVVEATFTSTPKDLDQLKKQQKDQTNATAYSLLLPTDWMVIKALETQTTAPADWSAWRAAVRTTANDSRTAIDACTTVEELAALTTDWPKNPDQVAAEAAAKQAAQTETTV